MQTFADIHAILGRYVPPIRSQRDAYTLERMVRLMDYLGNPQASYKIVHVAGTSGKSSTCYYIASMLRQAGKRVGLTVSPHVDEINERVQLNLKPLSEKRFVSEFGIFLRLVEESKIQPTYFELLAAFAFWEFARRKVEYAVVEVGLGGLLDATNVIDRRDKLCVITDIGLDHMEVLGRDVATIAAQKAGIVKPYNLVVSYEQGDEVMDVLREVCTQQQAELHEIWPLRSGDLPRDLPLFQRRNWYLALSAYNLVAERDDLPALGEAQLAKSTRTYIPARMEEVVYGDKTVILDGAHNAQKLHSLVSSIKRRYPKQQLPILVSFVTTKQSRIRQCLEELLPICERLVITTFTTENAEKVSVDPLRVVEHCESLGFDKWQVVADPVGAFRTLNRSRAPVVLVTGSFYLLNHIRPIIKSDN
jgi:dihydrofolate synthase/folylpolyglutamate synthase